MSAQRSSTTVWTSTATNRSETAGDEKVYHTDKSCCNLQNADQTADHPLDALSNGWRECETCSGEAPQSGAGSERPCPFCGEEFVNLPSHLHAGCDG